jgi:outer membrane receptor for ferrienterochelin and colicins
MRRRVCMFAVAAALTATPAFSQEKADDKKDAPATSSEKKPTQTLEKIEVTTSQAGYDARQDDTATKIVVTAEEIKKYGDAG